MSGRRLRQRLFWFAGMILGISSWIGFLLPVGTYFAENPGVTFAQFMTELLKFSGKVYPSVPLGGYLFIAVSFIPFLVLVYFAGVVLRYIESSYVGISVLETQLTLEFHDTLLENSSLTRRQILHANKPDVAAYHVNSSTTSEKGKMLDDRTEFYSFIDNKPITKEILTFGRPNKRELVEVYDRPLPNNIIATLAPNAWVLWAWKQGLFKRTVVKRTGLVVHENEYVGAEPKFSIESRPYPCTLVSIVIDFPLETAPPATVIRAFLVKENVAEEISIVPKFSFDRVRYEVRWRNFHQSSIRLTWNNEKLEAYRKRNGLPPAAASPKAASAETPPASAALERPSAVSEPSPAAPAPTVSTPDAAPKVDASGETSKTSIKTKTKARTKVSKRTPGEGKS